MKSAAKTPARVLLFGYGNPGRLDDGLGPALAEAVEALNLPGLQVDSDYQLNLEDAATLAEYDVVIFTDASTNCPEPFALQELKGAETAPPAFTSHAVGAEDLLALCREMFSREPKAYMLSVRGYEFNEFGERLSEEAQANLKAAVEFVKRFVVDLELAGD